MISNMNFFLFISEYVHKKESSNFRDTQVIKCLKIFDPW